MARTRLEDPQDHHTQSGVSGRQTLSRCQVFCYSVGHVLNDLCASMWFSYFLIFYHQVLLFSNEWAGVLLLIGQVADAMSTPFVGFESDRTLGFKNYGRRKSWHLVGVLCVGCSFIFVFSQCIGCEGVEEPQWARAIYYSPFIVLFQFGWAATQVSHLAIIPELTPSKHVRGNLNAYRYAFTVLSNIFVFVSFTIFLIFTTNGESTKLEPSDHDTFTYMALLVVGVGGVFMIVFHVGLKEPPVDMSLRRNRSSLESGGGRGHFRWQTWFKEPQFYLIGALYMFTRLVNNFTQVYFPLFISVSLELNKTNLAILPLVTFVSGFAASMLMKPLNQRLNRMGVYFLAMVVCGGYLSMGWFVSCELPVMYYTFSIVMGAGNGTLLVTVLSIISDMIGPRTHTGAMVYGIFSFLDKLSSGIAVNIAQNIQPPVEEVEGNQIFYTLCLSLIPGVFLLCALIVWAMLLFFDIGVLRHHRTGLTVCDDKDYRDGLVVNEAPTPVSGVDNSDSGTDVDFTAGDAEMFCTDSDEVFNAAVNLYCPSVYSPVYVPRSSRIRSARAASLVRSDSQARQRSTTLPNDIQASLP